LPRPLRTPAGIRECLIALWAQRRRRCGEQACEKILAGTRGTAQSGDIRAADVADIALGCGPSRNGGVDDSARLLALRGHPCVIGVEAGFQARTERTPLQNFAMSFLQAAASWEIASA